MSSPLQLRFLTSADDVSRLPDTPAELAFIGRSNVGKSSLVNALANRKDLARVAKAPGRTQLLNCFEVEGLGTLVDCPGYGYASAPARVREGWQRMVETYLLEREQLTMVVLLVDGEIGPTKLDLEMLRPRRRLGSASRRGRRARRRRPIRGGRRRARRSAPRRSPPA
jgi:GTP-binding protein